MPFAFSRTIQSPSAALGVIGKSAIGRPMNYRFTVVSQPRVALTVNRFGHTRL